MKPVDFRNATFASLETYVTGQRASVLDAWRTHGPCTTLELAARSNLSVLNVRPRTHELLALGFVCLAEQQPAKGEGTYRARSQPELAAWIAEQGRLARGEPVQRQLSL
jgi:hypothetical protein